MITEKLMLLKKRLLLSSIPERRGHAMPCKVTWGSSRCGQEVERSEGKA